MLLYYEMFVILITLISGEADVGSSRCRSIISADLRRGTRSYSNLTKTRLAVDRDKAPEILVTPTESKNGLSHLDWTLLGVLLFQFDNNWLGF